MKVLILQTGEPIPSDGNSLRPMRATNLTNVLIERGHTVELISSRFFHQRREHRRAKSPIMSCDGRLTITLIKSVGYKSSLGLSRLVDHVQMSVSLFIELLRKREKPDVVFIGYPPIETAYVVALWSIFFRIPYMLDVKDFWPDTLRRKISVLPGTISRFLLYPYEYMAGLVTNHASSICTISPEALDWWNSIYNRKGHKDDIVGYLSSSFECQSFKAEKDRLGHAPSRFIYAGSLTSQLSVRNMFAAFSTLSNETTEHELLIIGDGPMKETMLRLSLSLPGVKFIDWQGPKDLIPYLKESDAVLIPYKSSQDFELSIPNKAFDALVFRLPIISPLKGSLLRFIQNEGIGYAIDDTVEGWLNAFKSVASRDQVYLRCLHNTIDSSKRFSIVSVYSTIAERLESIANVSH